MIAGMLLSIDIRVSKCGGQCVAGDLTEVGMSCDKCDRSLASQTFGSRRWLLPVRAAECEKGVEGDTSERLVHLAERGVDR